MVDISRSEYATILASAGGSSQSSYVDWPAILAGTVLATAISFVLNTFGAAIGLSVVSPFDQTGTVGTGLLIAVALWVMWVTVTSFMLGAYAAGRLRRRANDATEHEVDVRDGVHGLTVWAVGILLSALIFASGLDTALRTGAEAASGAGAGADAPMDVVDRPAYEHELNKLFRTAPEAAAAQPRPDDGTADRQRALRDEFTAILEAAGGDVPADDRTYMASTVAAVTGTDGQQAAGRVEGFVATYRDMQREAVEAAETARKASIVGAFVLAASLLIAAAGAWWAAGVGGGHRDEQTVFGLFGRRR